MSEEARKLTLMEHLTELRSCLIRSAAALTLSTLLCLYFSKEIFRFLQRPLLAVMPQGEGRLCTIRMSVNKAGWLDMYQWIYFLVQHASYHLALIDQRLNGNR